MLLSNTLLFTAFFISFNAFSQPADLLKRAETDPRAQFELGQMYVSGDGIEKNYTKALDWLNKSAASDNADAIALIGLLHNFGDGVPKDTTKAVALYKRAISLGGNRGMIAYANALMRGEGTPKNIDLAHTLLKTAVSNNSPKAMYILGSYYINKDIESNTEGRLLISKAADLGNQDAITRISAENITTQQDPVIAEQAFKKILPHKGKDLVADYGIAYYYLYFKNPPEIQATKEVLAPYLDKRHAGVFMLMAVLSSKENDYKNMFHYMHETNKEAPGTYDIKAISAEYKAMLEKRKNKKLSKRDKLNS